MAGLTPEGRARMAAGGRKSRRPAFAPDADQAEALNRVRLASGPIDRRAAVVAAVDEGVPLRVVAEAAGLNATTVMRWAKA